MGSEPGGPSSGIGSGSGRRRSWRSTEHRTRLLDRQAVRVAATFLALFSVGTIGFTLIEGWHPFDALYMTLITITTIGYGETHPLSTQGRIFNIVLIVVGVGNSAYTLGAMTQFFASGGWNAFRRRARMQNQLDRIRHHTIICGFGRLGTTIADGLLERGAPFVVVERNAEVLERLRNQDRILFVSGDASDDDTLKAAGILRARTLVTALDDDASNVFLTLTARVLNPALIIYGKADDPSTLIKLQRAGADHPFSPALVAGHRVAMQIVRPAVMDLVELATGRGQLEFAIEEFPVDRFSECIGKALSKTPFWGREDFMILAVRSVDGTVRFPPRPAMLLSKGDSLIVMGKGQVLSTLPGKP